jgi:subtilase family serine protease
LEENLKRFISALVLALLPILGTMAVVPRVEANADGVPSFHAIHVCGLPNPNSVHCSADVLVTDSGVPQATGSPAPGSYGPAQFHTAYQLPCSVGGAAVGSNCAASSGSGSQTIAIVDAYEDPNIEADLGVYDAQYGLPACTQRNGCLKIVDMCTVQGKVKHAMQCYSDQGWELEASLDVEVAHAMCQTCKIVFVEASYSDWTNLGNAEAAAAQNGATEISNSWGGREFSGEALHDSSWSYPGVAVLFASGDSNYATSYPAVDPTVIAVGGTTLVLNANNTYSGEKVWSNAALGQGTGSGCSLYETASSWQTALTNWGGTGCGPARGSTDISADADPATGAAVYDSFGYNGTTGWYTVGGTSLATPLIASTIALAGGAAAYSVPAQLPYLKLNPGNSHDVTVGANGSCGTSMCNAGPGYDGPTGLGTPMGAGGL